MLGIFVCGVLEPRQSDALMSDLNKLIKAIKLRDVNQVRTILDEDDELVRAYDETAQPLFTTRRLMDFAKSSNCCSTEAQK